MLSRFRAPTLIAALACVPPVLHAQAKPPATSQASVQSAINDGWTRAIDAMKKGDTTTIFGLYANDAIMIDPSMPTVIGKPNIVKIVKDMFASTKILDITRQQTALEVSGVLAVENGTYTQTVQEPGKEPHQVSGRYTMVWKKVGGNWLVLRDVSTPMPPAPTKP